MLSDLERRLAQVLGGRLGPPFAGRVVRRGQAAPPGDGPVVRVAVTSAVPLDPALDSRRPVMVPGSAQERRVVRLSVALGFTVEPSPQGDDREVLAGADALLYALDAPDLRTAEALVQDGDPGFVVDGLRLVGAGPWEEDAPTVLATAEGAFWPVGATGRDGVAIERVRVREFRLPVRLDLDESPTAGGPSVGVRLGLGASGALRVSAGPAEAAAFGSVAVALAGAAGGRGAGRLEGGQPGPEGTVLADVADGMASLRYAPPAEAAEELLVVRAAVRDADGEDHLGVELARFALAVGP